MILALLLVGMPPAFAEAQVSDRDRLLNCFYDTREKDPDEARLCLGRLLEREPNDVPALLELGYFELGHKEDAAAIDAFKRAIAAGTPRADVRAQLGYLYLARDAHEEALEAFETALVIDPANEELKMQTAYLLDQMGRKRQARLLFEEIERDTKNDARRRQACTASEVLTPWLTKSLPSPYYVGLYTAPDWYSNIRVATLPLRLRAGVALGRDGRVELFGQSATLADTRSSASSQPGPIIYFDNVELVGGGASVQPIPRFGLRVSAVVGGAYDLIDRQRDRWRFDARAGAEYETLWQHGGGCPPAITTPFRPVLEVYGASIYLSRYDDLISTVRLRPGLRVLETARLSLDANLHLAGIVDTAGEPYNNLVEIGAGAIFNPRRIGVRFAFETVSRHFRSGEHDVVTRVRMEYATRF
jgi:tetratricopeptide (TPR) repeat protein